jgi:hypothetical protein
MPPSSRVIGAALPIVLPTRTVLPPSAQVRIWDLMPA